MSAQGQTVNARTPFVDAEGRSVNIPLEELLARTRQRLDNRLEREMGPTLPDQDPSAVRAVLGYLARASVECLAEAICDGIVART